jgi:hypothetical protein
MPAAQLPKDDKMLASLDRCVPAEKPKVDARMAADLAR